MAIKIQGESEVQTLIYNQIFMMNMSVTQKPLVNDSDTADYIVKITYRRYAVDENDLIHYHADVERVTLDSFVGKAMSLAENGDMELANSLPAIQLAVSKIIADKKNLPLEVV